MHINELKPWDDNPRVNDHAVDAVARSIVAFGFKVPILCDQQMTIVAGHTRLKAAQQLGLNQVPVIVVEMTERQRKAFAVADNRTAEIADWDMRKLQEVLEELRSEDMDLHNLGFDDSDLRRILANTTTDEDELPEVQRQSQCKFGQIYSLGDHRLLCGNSCDKNSFEILLDGQSIDMLVTSPPRYNNLDMGSWDSYSEFCSDIQNSIKFASSHFSEKCIVFWTSGNSHSVKFNLASLYSQIFESCGLEYLDSIAWFRPGISFSSNRVNHVRKNSVYLPARQWEPILVYRKPGNAKRMTPEGKRYMLDFRTDVWEVPGINATNEKWDHPTVAPVEIPYRALMAYSQEKDLILDPFAGSGTTVIAAEKARKGRRVYMVEINPAFCDVIINRWESYTGKRAKLSDWRQQVS